MRKHVFVIVFNILLPLVIITTVIILDSVNASSEIYIDVIVDKIRFDIPSGQGSTKLVDDIVTIEYLQLLRCAVMIPPRDDILDIDGRSILAGTTDLVEVESENMWINKNSKDQKTLLKNLEVPNDSSISIAKEDQAIVVSVESGVEGNRDISGIFDGGRRFSLSGENIRLNAESGYESLTVVTSKLQMNKLFNGRGGKSIIVLHLSSKLMESGFTLMEDLFARGISFAEPGISDEVENRKDTSTIKNGKVQFGGTGFFSRKRFLIREEILEESDFLQIPEDNKYSIDSIKVSKEGLRILLFRGGARELEKGKQIRLTRSISPSILDYFIKDPSSVKFSVVFAFIFSQFIPFLQGILRKAKADED